MELSTPTVQRLMEVGLLAAGNHMDADANKIFAAIAAVRPESEMPLIGRAIARLNKGNFGEAINLLGEAVEKNPESEMAMTFLGMALKVSGMTAASEDALNQVVQSGNNEAAVELAKSLLTPNTAAS